MSPVSIEDILRGGEQFFAALMEELLHLKFYPHEFRPDHLCFRVATHEEYAVYKNLFLGSGRLLSEATINGRLICTFALTTPFQTSYGPVNLLELPQPKADAPYPTGFEHAEFVLPTSFATFQERHADLRFKSFRHKPMNAELGLSTGRGQAKFHHMSLDRVIEIEETHVTDIVFDFDGTVIDAKSKIVEINRRVFSDLLKREVSVEEATTFFSHTFKGLFENFKISDPDEQNRAMNLWSQYSKSESFRLLDGVEELIRELQKGPYTLHIWTAREKESTLAVLRAHGLENAFATLNCATAFSSKPDPDSFEGYVPHDKSRNYLMLGDTSTDMAAAQNIRGIAGAALWDPHANEDALASAGAELFFRTPSEVSSWLESQKLTQKPMKG